MSNDHIELNSKQNDKVENLRSPVYSDTGILVGLAGQPNVGKTTIFNLLTGLSQHVGNWPGKTVERKAGTLSQNGLRLEIVDLPGTYSLTANSTEERVTRDFIMQRRPDVIIMVADASALERNLYLLAELLMLPSPVVLALNMMDVAHSQGAQVEPHVLEAALGLKVVPVVARKNEGLSGLVEAVEEVIREPSVFSPKRPVIAEAQKDAFNEVRRLVNDKIPNPYPVDWVALKLLEGDAEITEKTRQWLPDESVELLDKLLGEHDDAILDIASSRYEWIARMVRAAITRPRIGPISLTDRLDKFATHPVLGLLVLAGVFGVIFWLTFTVAAPIQNWLDVAVIGKMSRLVEAMLSGAPALLVSLLTNGVLGGAGIVLTFLPILTVFFFALGVLEDTGYLARAAYVMDRFMHWMGLHGKSSLPLFLGFGCNVPAVMGSRVIESRAGRILTILLAPLVPCSARFVVLAFLAPAFFGAAATFVSWGLVLFNLVVLAVLGIILNRTLFRGERVAFIMELPLYHTPGLRTIGIFVWNNTWAFMKNAGSIILLFAVVIWALSTFPGTNIEQSYLAGFGRAIAPLGDLMGMDWRMLVALLSSFIAKENAIAAMGVLFSAGGTEVGLAEALTATISPATALSFLVVTMLFIPCLATVAVMRQETKSWGWTLFSVILLSVIALGSGIIFYQVAHLLGMGS
jgi:ferrous iron transport protein B